MKKKHSNCTKTVVNKRIKLNYFVLNTYEAGIVLTGPEVKSMRAKKVYLNDSHARFINNELFLINFHIEPYKNSMINSEQATRNRKLLLHRRELQRIQKKNQSKGLTLIPASIYLKNNRFKVELALSQGKKMFDKRQSEKNKTEKMRMLKYLKTQ